MFINKIAPSNMMVDLDIHFGGFNNVFFSSMCTISWPILVDRLIP